MKASSESGLWAMLISRVSTAVRLDKVFSLEVVLGFVVLLLGWAVLGFGQALAHANVCGQSGPHHSPGGDKYDQEPPDHPHEVKDIKLGRGAVAKRKVAPVYGDFSTAIRVHVLPRLSGSKLRWSGQVVPLLCRLFCHYEETPHRGLTDHAGQRLPARAGRVRAGSCQPLRGRSRNYLR